jgi:transcriptional regulator with XRE-family HTH domain
MQVSLGNKFKLIRNSLGLNQPDFADLVDISISSYKKYEADHQGVGAPALQKVASHPQCLKYALWLVTDETNIAAGQVAPGDPSPEVAEQQMQLSKEKYETAFKNQVEETVFMFCAMDWFKMAPDVKISDVGVIMLNKLQPIIDTQMSTNKNINSQKSA